MKKDVYQCPHAWYRNFVLWSFRGVYYWSITCMPCLAHFWVLSIFRNNLKHIAVFLQCVKAIGLKYRPVHVLLVLWLLSTHWPLWIYLLGVWAFAQTPTVIDRIVFVMKFLGKMPKHLLLIERIILVSVLVLSFSRYILSGAIWLDADLQ